MNTDFDRALIVLEETEPASPILPGVALTFAATVDLDSEGRVDLDLDGNGFASSDAIRQMETGRARVVYRAYFWDALGCLFIPWPVSLAIFDAGINQGRGPAVALLQEALNRHAATRLPVDGRMGARTLHAVQRAPGVLNMYLALRARRYVQAPGFETYGVVWLQRLFRIREV